MVQLNQVRNHGERSAEGDKWEREESADNLEGESIRDRVGNQLSASDQAGYSVSLSIRNIIIVR